MTRREFELARELANGLLTAFVICETIALDEVMRMGRGKRLLVAVTSRGHDPSLRKFQKWGLRRDKMVTTHLQSPKVCKLQRHVGS